MIFDSKKRVNTDSDKKKIFWAKGDRQQQFRWDEFNSYLRVSTNISFTDA